MLSKIQNKLLLKHPLLWNTRIVPLLAVNILIHLFFFVVGYANGTIDFEQEYIKTGDVPGTMAFLNVIVSMLVLVVWLVFYLRNNAFKALYPRKKGILYKEWLIILLACFTSLTYHFSFSYAHDLHRRNYFSEEEFKQRADVLSMASLFVDGGFQSTKWKQVKQGDSIVNEKLTSFKFSGTDYPLHSLMNKVMHDYSIQSHEKDSLNQLRVKGWLHNQQKDSVLWLLQETEKIVKSHDLTYNGNAKLWLDKTYTPPRFTKFRVIGREEFYPAGNPSRTTKYNNYDYTESAPDSLTPAGQLNKTVPKANDTLYVYNSYGDQYNTVNLIDNTVSIKDGSVYVHPKYYIPFEKLESSYGAISEAWVRPTADFDYFIIMFYVALGISLLIFSFRVTSGRSFLISIISFGITALLIGLFCLIFALNGSGNYTEVVYFIIWLLIYGCLVVSLAGLQKAKGLSANMLNVVIWLTPGILPVIFTITGRFYYYNYYHYSHEKPIDDCLWLKFIYENTFLLSNYSLIAYFIIMYFLTGYIRKWRGLPEA